MRSRKGRLDELLCDIDPLDTDEQEEVLQGLEEQMVLIHLRVLRLLRMFHL